MRADVVVDGLVAVDSGGEGSSVTDLIAVEILVLESLEEALDDAVGLGRAVAGTDVGELGPGGDVTSEGGRAEGGAVVGDDGNPAGPPRSPDAGTPRAASGRAKCRRSCVPPPGRRWHRRRSG